MNMEKRIFKKKGIELIDNHGNVFPSVRSLYKTLGIPKKQIFQSLKTQGYFKYNNTTYFLKNPIPVVVDNDNTVVKEYTSNMVTKDEILEFQEFRKCKEVQKLPFVTYKFESTVKESGMRYAVALFSDAHIEETVIPSSVLNLNEYNVKIAEERIKKYFVNLTECLNVDGVNELIFASLGDTISGYIHEELSQCNDLTPLEATFKAQSLILSGLQYICNNTNLQRIKFIGIVGNHSRTTKKVQHANGFKLSYEWLMYKNIEEQSKLLGLPIDFCIPESEIAIIDTVDNKRFIFCHGFQIKGGGNSTICGIYPSLNRLALKWNKTFKQDRIYLGHFHQCTSINNAVVNGSIIGYNAFALTNGMSCEEPCQYYEVHDTNIGQLLSRKIYCK